MKKFLTLLTLCLISGSVYAQETTDLGAMATQSDILNDPYQTRYMYREMWYNDNQPDFSFMERIEQIKNDPRTDAEIVAMLTNAMPLFEKMSANLQQIDPSTISTDIQNDPVAVRTEIAEQLAKNLSATDTQTLQEMSDAIQPYLERQQKQMPMGKRPIMLDINQF